MKFLGIRPASDIRTGDTIRLCDDDTDCEYYVVRYRSYGYRQTMSLYVVWGEDRNYGRWITLEYADLICLHR